MKWKNKDLNSYLNYIKIQKFMEKKLDLIRWHGKKRNRHKIDNYIFRLQIAMDNFLLLQELERLKNLNGEPGRHFEVTHKLKK